MALEDMWALDNIDVMDCAGCLIESYNLEIGLMLQGWCHWLCQDIHIALAFK